MKTMVLDCTLRDGGYCNNWKFGLDNVRKIVSSLDEAEVDIVECGFLTSRGYYDCEFTKYTRLDEAEEILKDAKGYGQYVVMINFGEYDLTDLPKLIKSTNNNYGVDGGIDDKESLTSSINNRITGIRLAFHKKDRQEALKQARIIKDKGYRLFLQPMVTHSYRDEEFIELIRNANELEPYAFYIVDSFGTMKRRELERLFYLVDHNLADYVKIGFHSHNNMQLAYSNAQILADMHRKHDLIIDCSIYGMGRGAGNLNTELFLGYLNENFDGEYKIRPLIKVIDEVLDSIYRQNNWGYSLPNYLSASYDTHPNYARYLSEKNTLTVSDMDSILGMMEDEYRINYNEKYIEELYVEYLSSGRTYESNKSEFKELIKGKEVILIAPGRSSKEYKEKIENYIQENSGTAVTISINHKYEHSDVDFIFISNLRRFRELDKGLREKSIVTSNIATSEAYIQTNYAELLNNNAHVRDNAGLMAIRFLMNFEVRRIVMAGFDGYSYDSEENYADKRMVLFTKKALVDAMNIGMEEVMAEYKNDIDIIFLTEPRHLNIR